jgi:flagellar biosynthesis/type III secretory pathway protein FliH
MREGSRILKGVAPLPGRRIEAVVWDADRRVREMVAAAEEEARRIVADAEAARAHALAEAIEGGRREGQARAAAALVVAASERDRLLASAERQVVELALAVARKVLGRELAAGGEALVDLAAAAVAEARARRDVVLRVSPADAATFRAADGTFAALSRVPVRIVEDPSIAQGGVIVETEAGRIDARIEAQLEAIAHAIEEAIA